jgi:hypothetical protein
MRVAATLLALVPLAFATPIAPSAQPSAAPLYKSGEHIEDAYIIKFKEDINPTQIALHLSSVEATHGLDVSARIHLVSRVTASVIPNRARLSTLAFSSSSLHSPDLLLTSLST